jgi:Zinc carboxypeptidase
MTRGGLASLFLAVLTTVARPATAAVAPSPESFLGFRVGDDRKLADWTQAVAYFQALAAASPRVRVENVGKTSEGRPFLVVTITSEANMARLEEIRQQNLRLADPRGLGEAEAERLIAGGKTIVALNHGIHSDEVAASQTALETAYTLATADDPATRQILDETVILMLPSHNPDGMQRVTEWYRKTLGTPFEGEDPPFLYQKYTGHDNNRDWYMFTQAETRLTVEHLYDRWHPQIVHDLHQMGYRGARIFLPPYLDPWEPNVDPALRSAVAALGSYVAAVLTGEGKAGVVTQGVYDAWSPSRAYPHTHGGVRLLSECASVRLATPIDVPFADLEIGLGYDAKHASWNFPLPWTGGRWRLRDIVDYQLSATRAVLEHAARNRDYWLRNFLGVNRRAAARQQPYAFVIPATQADPLATGRLLDVLRTGGVEIQRSRRPFEAIGQTFASGSHVILMAQPVSAFAKMLLERQQYPDLRQYPGGPPQRPYDATAHTLPLLMGVDVRTADAPFAADLERSLTTPVRAGTVEGRGPLLALGHANGDMVALGRLLRSGVPVRWALEAFGDRGRRFEAGTLLAPGSARAVLQKLATELGVTVRAVEAAPRSLSLRRPRVGLYQSWVPAIDEGWTRYVFEHDVGVDYETLHDADVRRGALASRFDAIVLPDQAPKEIVEGHPAGRLPGEYTDGIGEEGVAQLKAFVQDGGTLVALNTASRLVVEDFGLPVKDALPAKAGRRAVDAEGVYAPGSILRVALDETVPLAHGLGPSASIWFESSPAFEITSGRAVARYADDDPLLSGWLLGGERLKGKTALAELPLGKGRVVLFGFKPQYRAQSWGTYVALLNALYLSAASPSR